MIKPLLVCASILTILLSGCATATPREPRQCSVHQEPMTSELVVLRNGTASWEYQEAREKYFPFSGTVYTGNILPSTQQQIAQAEVCPSCRKTEMKWFKGDFDPNAAENPKEESSTAPNGNLSPEENRQEVQQPK